jgi:hypothetical protein
MVGHSESPESKGPDCKSQLEKLIAGQAETLKLLEEIKNSRLSPADSEIEKQIKEKFRTFMLKHCNIRLLNDKTEGEMYDFMVDSLWDIALKAFF